MSYMPRGDIENVWFDLENTHDINKMHDIFKNGWDFVLVDASYVFDDEMNLEGLKKLKKCDSSKEGDRLYFYLTTFADVNEFSSVWVEEYSAEDVSESEKEQWQLAFSGMYFYPTNRDWCGIYMDCPGKEFVIFGADKLLVSKIKMSFKQCSLLTVKQIEILLEKRDLKFT